MIGGTSQLLRIFRPERLPPPPPRLDAVELLTLLVEQIAAPARIRGGTPGRRLQPEQPCSDDRRATRRRPARKTPQRNPPRQRNVTLQSNPFVVAAAVAITGASVVVAADWLVVDSLRVHRISNAEAPVLDGDTSDPVWRNIQPFFADDQSGRKF